MEMSTSLPGPRCARPLRKLRCDPVRGLEILSPMVGVPGHDGRTRHPRVAAKVIH
jgi:hypothetical protein